MVCGVGMCGVCVVCSGGGGGACVIIHTYMPHGDDISQYKLLFTSFNCISSSAAAS